MTFSITSRVEIVRTGVCACAIQSHTIYNSDIGDGDKSNLLPLNGTAL